MGSLSGCRTEGSPVVIRRSMKHGLSKRRRADILEDFEEHLIPELCRMICFPALYWLKASTLPSILHRVAQLLIAEDLRIIIASETNLGILTLPSDVEWPTLNMIEKEIEQSTEPLLDTTLDTTLDDTIESTQSEPQTDINELELDGTLNEEINIECTIYKFNKRSYFFSLIILYIYMCLCFYF